MVSFKKKCSRCKKNFVLVTQRSRYLICAECHTKEMVGEVTDPELKKLLDIPEAFYEKSMFLRDIKIKCLKYGALSEKQIEAFKKTVKDFETAEIKEKEEKK